ncbi:hypothetical protein ACFE04_002701 [Oxalis oulophora]
MSAKDCGHHGKKKQKLIQRICAGVLVFIFLVLLVILLVWAILRPTKPRFILQDATVFAFNVSAPNILTSNFQVTVSSRNPNDDISIYYDKMDVYATYRGQQITLRTRLPSTYQDHKETNVWSPFIYGTSVPIAPYNGPLLQQEQNAGAVMLMIRIDGRVKWKVGSVITGHYHMHVKCPAYIQFGNPTSGVVVGDNVVKYQLLVTCSVSV